MTPQQEETLHHRGLVTSVLYEHTLTSTNLQRGEISGYVQRATCQTWVTEQVQS